MLQINIGVLDATFVVVSDLQQVGVFIRDSPVPLTNKN
jgi:hypothetical protein